MSRAEVTIRGFLTPEHARLPPTRRERVIRVTVAGTMIAAVIAGAAAGATWWAGLWGSYEHQLKAAVRHGDCVRISVNHDGWGGDLNQGATDSYAAFCDELGPSVNWVRYRTPAGLRAAIAADAAQHHPALRGRLITVCVNTSAAELVAFDEIAEWKIRMLCHRRGARIIRTPGP